MILQTNLPGKRVWYTPKETDKKDNTCPTCKSVVPEEPVPLDAEIVAVYKGWPTHGPWATCVILQFPDGTLKESIALGEITIQTKFVPT